MPIRNTLAAGYKRIDKEDHISLIFYILYVRRLSFGWDAKGEADTTDGREKAAIEDISQIRGMYLNLEYDFIEAFLGHTWNIYSK